MRNKKDLGLYQTQVQTNVAFTSFMTAVVVFFNGLLLTSFGEYDASIRIPIAFLIVSTFGFLYSTLIYTNTAEEVAKEREDLFTRSMALGDIVSEYLGVYLLVLSIPLVVNIVTQDIFLRVVTITSALAGLAVYQFSSISMVKRHFSRRSSLVSFTMLLSGMILFLAQLTGFYFTQAAIIFVGLIIIITYGASRERLR